MREAFSARAQEIFSCERDEANRLKALHRRRQPITGKLDGLARYLPKEITGDCPGARYGTKGPIPLGMASAPTFFMALP